jgi:hypothetical protein
MTTTVETIEAAMMPLVQHPALRSRPQKERSSAIRKLLRQVKIKNVSVTSDHGSMCFGTSVRFVPLACPERGPDHGSWNCAICKRNTEAGARLREIILAAFPDMDDRSDSMTDYFDQPFSVHADWCADGEVEMSKAAEPAHEEETPRYYPTSSWVTNPIDRPAFLSSNEIAKAMAGDPADEIMDAAMEDAQRVIDANDDSGRVATAKETTITTTFTTERYEAITFILGAPSQHVCFARTAAECKRLALSIREGMEFSSHVRVRLVETIGDRVVAIVTRADTVDGVEVTRVLVD